MSFETTKLYISNQGKNPVFLNPSGSSIQSIQGNNLKQKQYH